MSAMSSPLERIARGLFFRSLRNVQSGYLEVVCPDETHAFGDAASELRAMAVIHDERFFIRAVSGADIGMGESFMDGDWTSPDLVGLVRLAVRNLRLMDSAFPAANLFRRLASRIGHRLRSNSLAGSRRNIRHHYDLGNDFYRLFLDEQMVYSAAIFPHPEDSLESAQRHKLDLICRKLRLGPGDRVLEIGCGWGAFALHAARRYGAHVTGLTLSPAQHAYASAMASKAVPEDGSVRFLLEDYRKVSGQFDKIVSIEMFEAVGLARYDEFFRACDRLLSPEGSMLLQLITLRDQEFDSYRKRVDWIQTYIFPGSELASLREVYCSLGRSTQMAVTQIESFGQHYARTLAHWRARFRRNLSAIERLGLGPRFQRMWEFYLTWCEGAFLERYINVAQLLVAKNRARAVPADEPVFAADPLLRRASA
jgi:cyclopropane-fatty-acyl-phospholipid synthase